MYRVSQMDSRIDSVFVEGRSFVKMNLDAMALLVSLLIFTQVHVLPVLMCCGEVADSDETVSPCATVKCSTLMTWLMTNDMVVGHLKASHVSCYNNWKVAPSDTGDSGLIYTSSLDIGFVVGSEGLCCCLCSSHR